MRSTGRSLVALENGINVLNHFIKSSVVIHPESLVSTKDPIGKPSSKDCCFRFLGNISIGAMYSVTAEIQISAVTVYPRSEEVRVPT